MKRKLTALIAVFLLPLIALAGFYPFDTGEIFVKKSKAVAAAAGEATTIYYIPSELGTTITTEVDEVRGYIRIEADSGYYKVDTILVSLQAYVDGDWADCGSLDSINGTASVDSIKTKTFWDLTSQTQYVVTDEDSAGGTNGYGLQEQTISRNMNPNHYALTFAEKYRFKVDVRHDSAAFVTKLTYRIYGINY